MRGRETGKKQMKVSVLCRQLQWSDVIEGDEGATPVWVVRESFSEEVTFRLRCKRQEGANHATVTRRRTFRGREHKCKVQSREAM